MKSFSTKQTSRITFDVNGEQFEAVGAAPAGTIIDAATAEGRDAVKAMITFLDTVLVPESAKRFAERMRDPEQPIDIATLGEVAEWLIEQYSGRPTDPSSPSSSGQGGTGPSSTAPLPSPVSTSSS